jgi:hypothetical protein
MSQANRPAPCRNQGKSREVRAKQMSGRVAACESKRSAAGGTLDLAPNCVAERPTGGVCPHRETHRGRTFVLCRRRRTSPSGATYVSVGGDLGQKDLHGAQAGVTLLQSFGVYPVVCENANHPLIRRRPRRSHVPLSGQLCAGGRPCLGRFEVYGSPVVHVREANPGVELVTSREVTNTSRPYDAGQTTAGAEC